MRVIVSLRRFSPRSEENLFVSYSIASPAAGRFGQKLFGQAQNTYFFTFHRLFVIWDSKEVCFMRRHWTRFPC